MYKPYTYLIGWSNQNKWYYGAETSSRSKVANPNNLWNTYFTSSQHVKRFAAYHGAPDIIQIRKIFETKEQTLEWEHKVLRRIKAANRKEFLNKTDNKGIVFDIHVRKRISLSKIGNKNPNFGKKMIRNHNGNKNPVFGKTRKLTTKLKISNTLKEKQYLKDCKWYHDPVSGKSGRFKINEQPNSWLIGRK